jgi:hypothetical protein
LAGSKEKRARLPLSKARSNQPGRFSKRNRPGPNFFLVNEDILEGQLLLHPKRVDRFDFKRHQVEES